MTKTMRAAVYSAYGGPEVVRLEEVPLPAPRDDEVLIRIAAASVSSADGRLRSLEVPTGFRPVMRLVAGIRRPRRPVLGTEFCGTVVETGRAVTRFQVGDAVIAFPGMRLGGHAEFATMRASSAIIAKPACLDDAKAACLSFGGTTALTFLRDIGRLRPGQRLLIVGASGSVGSAAVQIARHFGAEVTAVTSGANAELVRGLGADHVVDYTTTDFAESAARFDLILDAVGATRFAHARRALAPNGKFLMVVAGVPEMLTALATLPRRQKAVAGVAGERAEDMAFLAGLAEQGVFRPLVEKAYPLTEIVAAHARVDSRRKRGNVVVVPAMPGRAVSA